MMHDSLSFVYACHLGKYLFLDLIFVYYVNACMLSDIICMCNGTLQLCGMYVCGLEIKNLFYI